MDLSIIQTGKFKEQGKELFGRTGLIDLDSMSNIELRTDIVLKSYKIIMHNYKSYGYFAINMAKDNEELLLFCNYEQVEDEAASIKGSKDFFVNSENNFWWNPFNNWMLIPSSKQLDFFNSIENDYNNWWMQRPKIERDYDYKLALTQKAKKAA